MKKRIIYILIITICLLKTEIVNTSGKNSNINDRAIKEMCLTNQKINDSSSDECDMVIISVNDFAPTLQPLINHKNSHGVKTIFKDIKDIYKEYPGRDEPEQIKYFIKDAIETFGISYVFLVGGIDYVPIRRSALNYQKKESFYVPTDLYYADIYNSTGGFSCWDANNNDIFGEYLDENTDDIDLYADVCIGRIPCINNYELKVVVDKIINYENNTNGSDWVKKILLMGGDTFPSNKIIDGEWINDRIAENTTDFEHVKLYTSLNTFKPSNINFQTNKGAGFISYSGHGRANCILTSKPNQKFPSYLTIIEKIIEMFPNSFPLIQKTFGIIYYNNFHLKGMNNEHQLPIAYFAACSTATLDPIVAGVSAGHLQYLPKLSELFTKFNLPNKAGFAYNIVKKEGGGAIASIGATRPVSTVDILHFHFFKTLQEFYDEGITAGEMLKKAQYAYLEQFGNTIFNHWLHIKSIEAFILIGDPSLKVGGYN
jgi:hypothetical protein